MRLVASQWNGPLAVSTDGGSTWAVREFAHQWTAVTSSADGVKLAASVRNGQIWLSDDGGVNWRSSAQSRAWVDVVSSPDGKFLAAAAQEGLVYTSADRGQTWIARDANRIWVALALSADSRELWACEYDGRLHHSGPQPATLVFQPAPEESGSPYASFSFQVADSGPEGSNLDPSPNVITFHVTPADDPPAVAIALPDQWAGIGRPFSFTIAPGSFADPDSGAPLAFSAVRADGGPLPP